jgi:hypothetical protein
MLRNDQINPLLVQRRQRQHLLYSLWIITKSLRFLYSTTTSTCTWRPWCPISPVAINHLQIERTSTLTTKTTLEDNTSFVDVFSEGFAIHSHSSNNSHFFPHFVVLFLFILRPWQNQRKRRRGTCLLMSRKRTAQSIIHYTRSYPDMIPIETDRSPPDMTKQIVNWTRTILAYTYFNFCAWFRTECSIRPMSMICDTWW